MKVGPDDPRHFTRDKICHFLLKTSPSLQRYNTCAECSSSLAERMYRMQVQTDILSLVLLVRHIPHVDNGIGKPKHQLFSAVR